MSDKTDHEARKMYDDAIEVILARTLTCLTFFEYTVCFVVTSDHLCAFDSLPSL